MENLIPHINETLTWRQPDPYVEEYELCCGDTLLGTLKFRSKFGTLATAETADGQWTFKRVGFLSPKVSVRKVGEEDDIATFKDNTWHDGGEVVLQDGTKYRATSNFWHTRMAFLNEKDQTLLRYPDIGGLFRGTVNVQILPERPALKNCPGW
jgi:hypothetical protein